MIDPVKLAGMSDDEIGAISQQLGYDPQQVMSDRADAQRALGVNQGPQDPYGRPDAPPAQPANPYSAPAEPPLWQTALAGAGGAMMSGGTPMSMPPLPQTAGGTSPADDSSKKIADDRAAMMAARQRGADAMSGGPPMAAAPVRPGGRGGYGVGDEVKAIKDESAAQQEMIKANQAKQAGIDQMNADHQQAVQKQAADAAVSQAHWNQSYANKDREATAAERASAEGKLDKDRFYKNEDGSTNYGKKIGAAIAVALGAFGASLSKGPNYALEIINKAVDDDMAVQRANLAKGEREADKKRAGVKEMRDDRRQDLGDERLTKIQALADFRQQLADTAARTTDPQAKAQSQSVVAATEKNIADLKHQYAKEGADAAARNRQLDIEEKRVSGSGRASPAVQANVANAQAALRALNEFEAEANKGPLDKIGDSGAGKDKQVALESALARMGKSSLSSRNKEIYESMTGGNPADWVSWGRGSRLKALRHTITDELRTAAAGGGMAGSAPTEAE